LFFETTSEDEPTGGALMLNVDYDRYLNTLLSFNGQGDCMLLDETGALLTAGREELQPLIPLFFGEISREGQADSGYILKRINGEQTVCLYCRLDTSRWHYLKITPLKACVPKLLELKNALIVCIVIGFALLAICSLGVLLFLYFPVYQVRAALRNIGMENKRESLRDRSHSWRSSPKRTARPAHCNPFWRGRTPACCRSCLRPIRWC